MKLYLILVFFFYLPLGLSEEQDAELKLESLRKVLEHDKLLEEVKKKKKELEKKKKVKKKIIIQKSYFPSSNTFWEIFSNYWVSKNAPFLKWDDDHPDYGIGVFTQKNLNQIGFIEKKIRILYSRSPLISHFSLPTKKDNYFLILSIPFLEAMDLNKSEISMLVFEEMIRSNLGYTQKIISDKSKVNTLFNIELSYKENKVKEVLKKLNLNTLSLIKETGFSFQMQYEITKRVKEYLSSHAKLLKDYQSLCSKRKNLVENNKKFKYYSQMYPSPEMQVKWLKSL